MSPDLCAKGGAALFCEGFEAALGSEWVAYDGTFGNGCGGHSVGHGERDTNRAHSGSASWHANVNYIDNGSCQAELRRDMTIPTPDAFVRMFVYVPSSTIPSVTNTVELNMLLEGHQFGAVGPTLTGANLGFESYGDVSGQGKEPAAFPTDKWVCVEWQLHQGSSPTFTAWRDGTQAISTPLSIPSLAEPLDALFFGLYGYNNLGNVDVWFDDVALATTRIGCVAQ
jgi:hypothetical protein